VVRALERMLAMRAYQRSKHVDQRQHLAVLEQVGHDQAEVEEMYQVMAIANYEDRFVIPTAHREYAENAFNVRGGCGFSFGNGCSDGASETSLFGSEEAHHPHQGGGLRMCKSKPLHNPAAPHAARAGAPAGTTPTPSCAAHLTCPRCATRCTPSAPSARKRPS
jgi:hypothetical protein